MNENKPASKAHAIDDALAYLKEAADTIAGLIKKNSAMSFFLKKPFEQANKVKVSILNTVDILEDGELSDDVAIKTGLDALVPAEEIIAQLLKDNAAMKGIALYQEAKEAADQVEQAGELLRMFPIS